LVRGDGAELGLAFEAIGHGKKQIEGCVGGDVGKQVGRVVFGVGEDERLAWGGLEDVGRQAKKFGRGLGDGAGRGAEGEGQRLMGFGVESEKDLGCFDGTRRLERDLSAHLAFAPRAHAMRINGQEVALIMTAGTADFSQGDLKGLGLGDGVPFEHLMDGLIGGDKRQAVGQFEALLAERAIAPDAGRAQGRLVDQLKGQARIEVRSGPAGPGLKQVPRAQAQVFGRQKPETDLCAGDLVGQQLADTAFEASVIARFDADGAFGALGFDRGGRRPEGVEFFFEGPSR
jgi:hypothetical protein